MSEKNPHDRLLRATLEQKENASAELVRILPASVVTELDLSSVKLRPRSTVDQTLDERATDCVFDVRWRGGTPAVVVVLYEHQSEPDPMMPWRMLEYMVRLWRQWLNEHPGARVLPSIIPVVLYHGRYRWRGPPDLKPF